MRRLARVAVKAMPLAFAWHLAIGAALVALRFGAWRPTLRLSSALLGLPLLSVSLAALSAHSPFNGAAFGGGWAVLATLSLRARRLAEPTFRDTR